MTSKVLSLDRRDFEEVYWDHPRTVGALQRHMQALAAIEGGPFDGGLPVRWRDRFRCPRGHVSGFYVEKRGGPFELCVVCEERVVLTFPEDRDGALKPPWLAIELMLLGRDHVPWRDAAGVPVLEVDLEDLMGSAYSPGLLDLARDLPNSDVRYSPVRGCALSRWTLDAGGLGK